MGDMYEACQGYPSLRLQTVGLRLASRAAEVAWEHFRALRHTVILTHLEAFLYVKL
jgi:hypothetical protein